MFLGILSSFFAHFEKENNFNFFQSKHVIKKIILLDSLNYVSRHIIEFFQKKLAYFDEKNSLNKPSFA